MKSKNNQIMLLFIIASGMAAMMLSTVFSYTILGKIDKVHEKVKFLLQNQ